MGNNQSDTQQQQSNNQKDLQVVTELKQRSKRIMVVVSPQDQNPLHLQIDIPAETLTCGWLLSEVIRKCKEKQSSTAFQIVQLRTTTKNEFLDYWLNKWERPLYPFHEGDILKAIIYNKAETFGFFAQTSIQDFKPIKCIGKGGFSKVYLVRRKDTGLLYAMKTMKKKFIIDEKKVEQIMSERFILEQLNHPFLIKLKWAFQSRKELHLVLDFCPGGEFFFHLRNRVKLTEDQAKFYFSEILLGIEEIHRNNIVYRDLKPENVLLDLDGHIRLTDFGLSKLNIRAHSKTFSFCGSPEYMSPEMLKCEGHGRMVDFYSLGALLYEMLTGLPPFYDQNQNIMYQRIESEEVTFPKDLSHEVKSLMNELLIKDPEKRLGRLRGINEIKDHPWLENVNFKALLEKKINPPFIPSFRKSNFDPEYLNMPMDIEAVADQLDFLSQSHFYITASLNHFDPIVPNLNEENEEYFNGFEYIDESETTRSSYILQATPRIEVNDQNLCNVKSKVKQIQHLQKNLLINFKAGQQGNYSPAKNTQEKTPQRMVTFDLKDLKDAIKTQVLLEEKSCQNQNEEKSQKTQEIKKLEISQIPKACDLQITSERKIQPFSFQTIEVSRSLEFQNTNTSPIAYGTLSLQNKKSEIQSLTGRNQNSIHKEEQEIIFYTDISQQQTLNDQQQPNINKILSLTKMKSDSQDADSTDYVDSEANENHSTTGFQFNVQDYSEAESSESYSNLFSTTPQPNNLIAKLPAVFYTKRSKMKTSPTFIQTYQSNLSINKNSFIKQPSNTDSVIESISVTNKATNNGKQKQGMKHLNGQIQKSKNGQSKIKQQNLNQKKTLEYNIMKFIQREAQNQKVQHFNNQRQQTQVQKHKNNQADLIVLTPDKEQLSKQVSAVKQFNDDRLMSQKLAFPGKKKIVRKTHN